MKFFSSEYNSLHMEPEQLKRVKSAFNLKMDSVDFETQTGKIKNYDVSLDKCTCMGTLVGDENLVNIFIAWLLSLVFST